MVISLVQPLLCYQMGGCCREVALNLVCSDCLLDGDFIRTFQLKNEKNLHTQQAHCFKFADPIAADIQGFEFPMLYSKTRENMNTPKNDSNYNKLPKGFNLKLVNILL